MKINWIISLVSAMLLLAACGTTDSETTGGSNENTEQTEQAEQTIPADTSEEENEETETEGEANEEEASEAVDEEVYEVSPEEETVTESENLLDKNQVFTFQNGSVEMTLEKAVFTSYFEASNAVPEDNTSHRSINGDSDIYLHVTGKIINDTTDLVYFGSDLAPVTFFLTYDSKHEFEMNGTAESEEGSTLEASSIDALSERVIHIYAQVPKKVAETDKPLLLTVNIDEESYEIPLR